MCLALNGNVQLGNSPLKVLLCHIDFEIIIFSNHLGKFFQFLSTCCNILLWPDSLPAKCITPCIFARIPSPAPTMALEVSLGADLYLLWYSSGMTALVFDDSVEGQ